MPSGLQPDGSFLCKPCQIKFRTWEQLLKHKDKMRRDGEGKHIHCKFCGEDFKTEVAHMKHIQQFHPQAQNLECPGCHQGPFSRLGGLIGHIQGECTILDVSFIAYLREEKSEFATQLETLTKEPVKANYAHCMPAASAGRSIANIERDIAAFKLKKKEFPALSDPKPPATTKKEATEVPWDWNPAQDQTWEWNDEPSQEQMEKAAAPAPENWDEWLNVNDPGHPSFNVARYYEPIIGKYCCPTPGCGKCFKTSNAIIGHLKSPAHSQTKYRCPYCLRTFQSLAAITQHAESATVRCRMRETDTYGAFVDQLTGGLANVASKHYDDDTPKYEVSKEFRRQGSESPKAKSPKTEAPKVESPKIDTPKIEGPKAQPRQVESPELVLTKPQVAKTQSPKTEPRKTGSPERVLPTPTIPKRQLLNKETLNFVLQKPLLPTTEPPKIEPPKKETPKAEPLKEFRTYTLPPHLRHIGEAHKPVLSKPMVPKSEPFKASPPKSEPPQPGDFEMWEYDPWTGGRIAKSVVH